MNIKEEIHGMFHLQEIDNTLQGIEEKVEEVRQAISHVREPLSALETKRDDLADKAAKLRIEIPKMEVTIQDQDGKIQKSKDKLPNITTQKEYFALQKEIENMQKEKTLIEEDLLRQMGIFEEVQKEIDEISGQCQEEETLFIKKKQEMEKDASQFDSELARLKSERENVSREMNPKYLAIYNKVRKHKGSPAVVQIIAGNCQGCHMSLPPQLAHDVRKGTSIITCEFCSRILYVE